MSHAPLIIKVGGGEGIDITPVCHDVAELVSAGRPVVLIHGGSHETNIVAEKLGCPPKWITSQSGRTSRRTDRETMEIFQMVYCGKANKSVVEQLQKLGVNAVGLSGMDGRVWQGERKGAIRAVENGRVRVIRDDLSGTVKTINADLLRSMLDAGLTPVLCPPAISTEGDPINVDADRAAAATAGALRAEALVLLSNVPGLLADVNDAGSLIHSVAPAELPTVLERHAQGRMKNKVQGAGEALDAGVGTVVIASANVDRPVFTALEGHGTVFAYDHSTGVSPVRTAGEAQ